MKICHNFQYFVQYIVIFLEKGLVFQLFSFAWNWYRSGESGSACHGCWSGSEPIRIHNTAYGYGIRSNKWYPTLEPVQVKQCPTPSSLCTSSVTASTASLMQFWMTNKQNYQPVVPTWRTWLTVLRLTLSKTGRFRAKNVTEIKLPCTKWIWNLWLYRS
jgi:hypothetical protein